MVDRILIDTNILLDYLLTREPFYEDAREVVRSCTEGKIKECAKVYGAEYIVTRNMTDYRMSEVKAILPKDLLALTNK